MPLNLTQKIIRDHLVSGDLIPGTEIGIQVDQTLTQDATGTMAYLQFEAIGIPRVKTKLSVSYVDHNMLQTGFENPDDHRYLQSVAAKYGIYFSKPGNGICHQVHLERFVIPGQTLLGSDSHTPTAGAAAMLAIGVGGLDVAVAMGGGPYHFIMPKVVGVKLTGKLSPWVTAKDIILELLLRKTVKGGVGKVFEFFGPGALSLSVPERGTITNMGAELGATTSIFPSDEVTKRFFTAQGRAKVWSKLAADPGAEYDEVVEVDLSKLQPHVAQPSSPDNVVEVSKLEGMRVDQVLIGTCNNSSYRELMTVARILKGKKVKPHVDFGVVPGSRQVLEMISANGAIKDIVAAGARILESACGFCIGMGQAPPTNGISLRTGNRNFPGRSGTPNDKVYLCSPEVAVASALRGEITNPKRLGHYPVIKMPKKFLIDDSLIIPPPKSGEKVEVARGPNIAPLPLRGQLEDDLVGEVLIRLGDNITTDHIMPAGAQILPLRSNIPKISEYVFSRVAPEFVSRTKEKHGGFIVGGENYGQGSSREHAALAPMYLGIKAVFAKSFARIHRSNLINFGIVPLLVKDSSLFDALQVGASVEIRNARAPFERGDSSVTVNVNGKEFSASHDMVERERRILLAGGLLNFTKSNGATLEN
jgi:aconitate hydratase